MMKQIILLKGIAIMMMFGGVAIIWFGLSAKQ